ncbi:MAG TPA: alpha/beta hydrolase [Alphaproteobacteria bacterium]|nr:alpha/beta hydrolase [Alphaproteobacteria bacterium]
MTLILEIAAIPAVLYIAVLIGVALGQHKLTYIPNRRRIPPASLGLGHVREHVIEAPDGAELVAWHGPAGPGKPTLLYFHGNGGGLIDRAPRFELYRKAGIGLFIMSYRSYSGSTGVPSEPDNVADAHRAWDYLVSLGVAPEDIVLYGESLGTGVAVQVATRCRPRALILEAPYSSLVDIGAWRFPYLPVRLLMKARYESMRYIGKVKTPLLVVHGEADGIVPIRFGRKLFAAAASEPKRFVAYAGSGHMETYNHGAFDEIVQFIAVAQ